MIDVLVPVLGRPKNAAPLVESFVASSQNGHQIHFICSPSDEEEVAACHETGMNVILADWEPGKSDYPKKMNLGYRSTQQPFIFLGADDLTFQKGWDEIALNMAENKKVGIVGTNDCANRHVMRGLASTHPLVRRQYLDEQGGMMDGPGTFIYEGYDHNFCERELNGVAMYRHEWHFARNAKVIHRHPCWGTAPSDATYEKGTKSFREDQMLFYERSHLWEMAGLMQQEIAYKRSLSRQQRGRR